MPFFPMTMFFPLFREAVQKIKSDFFSVQDRPPRDEVHLRRMQQAFSAAIFHAPLERDLQLLSQHGAKNIYK